MSSKADFWASTISACSTAARRCPLAATSSRQMAPAGWRCTALNLLAIAMELAREDPAYEDVASKFWEHFLYIANAINHLGHDGVQMWDEEDGFFYDVLHMPDGSHFPAEGSFAWLG